MKTREKAGSCEYTPLPGFVDLRDYNLSPKELASLAEVQMLLRRAEDVRLEGRCIRGYDRERDLSARLQMTLMERGMKHEGRVSEQAEGAGAT